jgi:hypothetical protein
MGLSRPVMVLLYLYLCGFQGNYTKGVKSPDMLNCAHISKLNLSFRHVQRLMHSLHDSHKASYHWNLKVYILVNVCWMYI